MQTGSIKFFNAGKGFGFVTPDGGDTDIFLPAAALTSSGLQSVKQGQRVSFEQAPDTKGPKVIALKLLGDAPVEAPRPPPDRLSVYCDPGADMAADVLNEVRSAGYQLQMHDYVATPLGLELLRRLSNMLNEAGQSLVRRYDPLFLALQLDDRFISDLDFWTGIAEHPTLINGPVLSHAGKARICRSPEEVRAFLNKRVETAPGPKSLSPRIAAMLKGEAVPAAPVSRDKEVTTAESPPAKNVPAAAKPAPKAAVKPRMVEKKTAAKKPAAKKASVKAAKKPAKK